VINSLGRWAYLSVITPIIFGTTYLLTTEFLPPGRPMLAATMRSLPTGIVLVLGSRLPTGHWRLRFLLLSVLYCSAFFPLHFVAAYWVRGSSRSTSSPGCSGCSGSRCWCCGPRHASTSGGSWP
jgi:hypothetical protein